MTCMARNLGLEPEKLLALFNEGVQGVRMNYYPPCKQSNKVMGLTPHSDAVGLTLLTQVNDVQGLQIRRDEKWIPIVPIPGAFIVNVGDIIEIMSNGQYKSIEHRAVVNPEKERLSIAAFHSPNMKATVGPLPDLINEKKEAKYKSISREEFIKLVVGRKLDGKGLLSSLMISK
ncbi:Protein SRG1 [Linum grandiflorum]